MSESPKTSTVSRPKEQDKKTHEGAASASANSDSGSENSSPFSNDEDDDDGNVDTSQSLPVSPAAGPRTGNINNNNSKAKSQQLREEMTTGESDEHEEHSNSDVSSISEHIENDRSFNEIELPGALLPGTLSLTKLLNQHEDEVDLRQEQLPAGTISITSSSNSSASKRKGASGVAISTPPAMDDVVSSENRRNSNSERRSLSGSARSNTGSNKDRVGAEHKVATMSRRDDSSTSGTLSADMSLNIFDKVSDVDDDSLKRYQETRRDIDSNDFGTNAEHGISALQVHGTGKELDGSVKKGAVTLFSGGTSMDEPSGLFAGGARSLLRDGAFLAQLETEMASNQSSSLNTTSTEYKNILVEMHHNKIEYQSAMAQKDTLIGKMKTTIIANAEKNEQMLQLTKSNEDEIDMLKMQLEDANRTLNAMRCATCSNTARPFVVQLGPMSAFDDEWRKLETILNPAQLQESNQLKQRIDKFLEDSIADRKKEYDTEIKVLQDEMEKEKDMHRSEVLQLENMLAESNFAVEALIKDKGEKHCQEMDALRMYYEKKCAELEKNYSEDIFSRQSRHNDTDSDDEFSKEMGPAGDAPSVESLYHSDKLADLVLDADCTKTLKSSLNECLKILDSNYNPAEILKALRGLDLNVLLKICKYNLVQKLEIKFRDDLTDFQRKIEQQHAEQTERLRVLNDDLAHSGESELKKMLEEYDEKLQKQVALAKSDTQAECLEQIKNLVSNIAEDVDMPVELQKLKHYLMENHNRDLQVLRDEHDRNIAKLKEDHRHSLNSTMERARKRSVRDGDSDIQIIKERDGYKRRAHEWCKTVNSVMNYMVQCEDEVNKTLVEDIVRNNFEEADAKNSSNISVTRRVHLAPNLSEFFQQLEASTVNMSMLNASTSSPSADEVTEFSFIVEGALADCLNRLRKDADSVLALSTNLNRDPARSDDSDVRQHLRIDSTGSAIDTDAPADLESRVTALSCQLIREKQRIEDFKIAVDEERKLNERLEAERASLEQSNELLVEKKRELELNLNRAKDKIHELVEFGRQETVSEGFGATSVGDILTRSFEERIAALNELRDRARQLVVMLGGDGSAAAEHSSSDEFLHVIEEVCRLSDELVETARREMQDLAQQIDVADKKLQSHRHFMDEQAAEREQERDDAERKIRGLQDRLLECDKDRKNCERINSEVEALEAQMQKLSEQIAIGDSRFLAADRERVEAVDKVFVLRGIIESLESQLAERAKGEAELNELVAQLQLLVEQERGVRVELQTQLEAAELLEDGGNVRERVRQLEAELRRVRLSSDFADNEGPLRQIQLQLHDFELSLDKRIRELDSFHTALSNVSCSSPSEEMSIRDQIRPQTPGSTVDDCDVPLQQLARLKEKLMKHSRAEDAAMKRINDLEMQIIKQRHEYEEIHNERGLLQDQISEQLVLISSLQMRLDDQRRRAEHIQKQTNTSLEVKIYDLENEITSLTEKVQNKEKFIRQLNKQVEDTKLRLEERERELSTASDDSIVSKLQKIIDNLKLENTLLQTRISSDVQSSQVLPNIVDNIIADKNSDIVNLRDQLNDTQRQLNNFLSLNLDAEQMRTLRGNDKAFGDMLSLIEPHQDQIRKATDSKFESFAIKSVPYNRKASETTLFGSRSLNFEPDFSAIEQIGAPKLHLAENNTPFGKQNSTEVQKSGSERKVHFEDARMARLRNENDDLKQKLGQLVDDVKDKEAKLEEFAEKIAAIDVTERKIAELQKSFEQTEASLKQVTDTLTEEKRSADEVQQNLQLELVQKKAHLEEQIKEFDLIQQDCARKDEMYFNLMKDKKALDVRLAELESANAQYKNVDDVINDKNKEIALLEEKLALFDEAGEKLDQMENLLSERDTELQDMKENYLSVKDELEEKTMKYQEIKDKYQQLNASLKEKDKLNQKFEKELKNKTAQITQLTEELKVASEDYRAQLESKISEIEVQTRANSAQLEEKIKKLQSDVVDRECELEILKEDINSYQNDIAKLESEIKNGNGDECDLKMMRNRKELAQKDLEIVKLKATTDDLQTEVANLQDYLLEKDNIIAQYKQDSSSLKTNLETIHSKIQENGNVVELRARLQEERALTTVLAEQLEQLKSTSNKTKATNKTGNIMTESIDEISGQIREELDYAAHLDSSILNAISSEDLKELFAKEKLLNRELVASKMQLQEQCNQLDRQVEVERSEARKWEAMYETEKTNCVEIQIGDANLIEQLRVRLEAAIQTEEDFRATMKQEKGERDKLQRELAKLTRSRRPSSESNSKTDEITEYKSLPSLHGIELQRLRDDVRLLRDENQTLRDELRVVQREKQELEGKLKCANDLVMAKSDDAKRLKKSLQRSRDDESALKEKWLQCKVKVEEKTSEVDQCKMREIEQNGELREAKYEVIAQKKINLELEAMRLKERDQVDSSGGRQQKDEATLMSGPVPDSVMRKINDLNRLVKRHTEENKALALTLKNLSEERTVLYCRLKELEERNHIGVPFDDPVARANHLFGRYLRSESFRKSLVWQKSFLIALLASYQDVRPLFPESHSAVRLEEINLKPVCRNSRGISKFKAVVICLISITRMQYLVHRWHSGRRMAAHLPSSMRTYRKTRSIPTLAAGGVDTTKPYELPTRFLLGEPVSGSNFITTGVTATTSGAGVLNSDRSTTPPSDGRRSGGASEEIALQASAWSGATPPSKDQHASALRRRLTESKASSSGLKAPELLNQYVDRFNSIQQRLGLNS